MPLDLNWEKSVKKIKAKMLTFTNWKSRDFGFLYAFRLTCK